MDITKNPWTIHSSEVTYENKWIRVVHNEGLNPAGGPGIYGVVHFKNLAIGVVALDAQHNIYLVGQYRFPLKKFSWEIPEGGGPLGEYPLDTAKRELLEETGLVANHWEVICEIALSNSVTDETGVVFLARELEQRTAEPEDTEQLMVKKLPFEEAYQMVKNFDITDSLSVAAIQKIKLMLLEGELV
ncbi:NUDIX domain-containing protein [Chitinophaga flava]|uniref:GDP-mannose pyrophosphatase n=1 Tax=Chitinophaga flava TaxID=2259036 RepID=A0A365XUM3_9BACT|nr:NUDIX hydrolase [Chitinophaga flava]RBL89404.1 DNA mismatch repair protein MutT [Chitinophaga flava]